MTAQITRPCGQPSPKAPKSQDPMASFVLYTTYWSNYGKLSIIAPSAPLLPNTHSLTSRSKNSLRWHNPQLLPVLVSLGDSPATVRYTPRPPPRSAPGP